MSRASGSQAYERLCSSPSAAAIRELVACRQRDRDEARADQLTQSRATRSSRRGKLELAHECGADFVQGLELLRPRRRRFVQTCVLDGDGSLCREQCDEFLVLVGEVAAALLLGQVEVAVRHSAQEDRDAEEAAHRRVAGRKSDRARILTEVVETQRTRVPNEHAEDAAAVRGIADRGLSGCVMPYVTKRSRPVPARSITPRAA